MKKTSVNKKKRNDVNAAMDKELWEHVTAGVKPLRGNLKNRAPKKEVLLTSNDTFSEKVSRNKLLPSFFGHSGSAFSLPELRHGTHAGLDKNNAKKLKKGLHPIEGRIDLHGMTQKQAHSEVNSFIQESFNRKKRCVLVITGKGNKQDGSVGVLRLAVPRWLNEEPNRSCILAFSYAVPKDGGEGALYVMLKRKR